MAQPALPIDEVVALLVGILPKVGHDPFLFDAVSIGDPLLDRDRVRCQNLGDARPGLAVAIDRIRRIALPVDLASDRRRDRGSVVRNVEHVVAALTTPLAAADIDDGRADEGALADAARGI